MPVEQLLRSMSSAEVSEWMAYFTLSAEEAQRPNGQQHQVSGDAALEVLRKHARRR